MIKGQKLTVIGIQKQRNLSVVVIIRACIQRERATEDKGRERY